MLNKTNYELIRTEKPFSKIIGSYELVVPLYNINIEVYVENEESLPPILDSVFSLYYLNYSLEEVGYFLGTDQEVIKTSFYELIDMDFIDYISKRVTDKGRKYYIEKKVTNYDRKTINLVINKLTGEILSNESHSYSSRRDMLDLNGKTKYLENEKIKVEEILTLKQVRKIWAERAIWDEKKYNGNILEIVNITERDNVYLKEDVVYVLEDKKNIELLCFFRNKRDVELEKFLYANEFDDPKITSNNFSPFFKEFILEKKVKYFSNDKNKLDDMLNLDILKTAKSKVSICIPMIEFMTISEDLILSIKTLIRKNVNVNIYISGWDFTSEHQRIQFAKLTSISKKNVSIFSLDTFIPYILIVDDAEGFETKYVIHKIEPKFKPIICVNLEYTEMSSQEIKDLLIILGTKGIKSYQMPNLEESPNETINRIVDNIYNVDELLTKEGYGWLSEIYPSVRDEEKLKEFKKVKTVTELKDFLSICTVSLIESFRARSQNPKDFENKFSKDYPDLFDVLNRIKVYRNYFMHGKLTPYNYDLFIKYIREDLEGYFLYGLDNLYEVLFLTILIKLDASLKDVIEGLLCK